MLPLNLRLLKQITNIWHASSDSVQCAFYSVSTWECTFRLNLVAAPFHLLFQLGRKKSPIESTGNRGYFRSVDPIRGSHCSRDPSLAVILGVSQSNKSQVELANATTDRARSWFIPAAPVWINRVSSFDNFASISPIIDATLIEELYSSLS